MKHNKTAFIMLMALLFGTLAPVLAQVSPGVYLATTENTTHELKITDTYLIYTVYESQPPKFVKTMGGFYTVERSTINAQLEFNSFYETDGVTSLQLSFNTNNGNLELQMGQDLLSFGQQPSKNQELDGQWLFATRGPDKGQDRRGEENPRKTLKFLMDGTFQWIAYQTETFAFYGTGGGTYTANNGTYTEHIAFFSRDNDRVGAILNFQYEVKGTDWHHTGKNSKGEPMYEIWSRRK